MVLFLSIHTILLLRSLIQTIFIEELDADNPAHVDWVCSMSMSRAEKYDIQGVDHRLTLGVLKRILPAVASTNAIIAGRLFTGSHQLTPLEFY